MKKTKAELNDWLRPDYERSGLGELVRGKYASPAKGVTLVAWYGKKPREFATLISKCQQKIGNCFGSAFHRYDPKQVHATIIGLEGCRLGDGIKNKNFEDYGVESRVMNPATLIEFLRSSRLEPIQVKIGGYGRTQEFGFTSRDLHPFDRSFAIRGEIAVAMGWPVLRSMPLEKLRRSFTEVNVLHKEHRKETDVDDDFYFVLGHVTRNETSSDKIDQVQQELRMFLADVEPVSVTISRDSLTIAAYLDTQLPLDSTRRFRVTDPDLNGPTLLGLYPRC
jgi:hypothetical protein